jgi:ferritin-like metal-binding protein YciE
LPLEKFFCSEITAKNFGKHLAFEKSMNAKEEVLDWLRDAYAMERGMEVTLKKISDSDRHCADCRTAAARHLEETRQHAETIASLLKSLGTDTSKIKTGIGMMAEIAKGIGTAISRDEQIKDLLASYAMEHFEIACYQALIAAAETAGLPEVADACEKIIADEEYMAQSISETLPLVIQDYLGGQTMAKAA